MMHYVDMVLCGSEAKTHRIYHMMLALTFVARCTENIDQLLTVQEYLNETQIKIAQDRSCGERCS
jgi:hypothetical protein